MSSETKWVIGSSIATTSVIVSIMAILIGPVNGRLDRVETDLRAVSNRLRAVEVSFAKVYQRLATLERLHLPTRPAGD